MRATIFASDTAYLTQVLEDGTFAFGLVHV